MTRAAAALLCAVLSGCAFDQGGIAHDGGGDDDDPPDAVAGGADARPDAVAPQVDATPSGPGVVLSRWVTPAPVLDADDAEWAGAEWHGYAIADSAQFAWRHSSYDDSAAIQFASLHDDQYIYLFIDVTDDLIRVDSTALYEDDAVTLYLDAAGDRSGPYGPDDHELVIDAEGTYDDFATGAAALTLGGQIQQIDGGYRMELRFTKSSLGVNVLPDVLGFDIALGDDDGYGNSNSDCHGLWFLSSEPSCDDCCPSSTRPWCDTTTLGRLVLVD